MAKTDNIDSNNFSLCKHIHFPYKVNIRFPGDLEYIPAVRKFIAEVLQVSNFSPKFAYRSEIIVDEICNNAVVYGCQTENAEIVLSNTISEDTIEFNIQDQGGTQDNVKRLKKAVNTATNEKEENVQEGLGLEIVRMLSERLGVVINEDNLTSVHIVRKREDEREDFRPSP